MTDKILARMVYAGLAAWVIAGGLWLAWRAYQRPCCPVLEFSDELAVCPHGKAWLRCEPVTVGYGSYRKVVIPGQLRIPHAMAMTVLTAELESGLAELAEASEE